MIRKNDQAIKMAKERIEAGQYTVASVWEDVQPTPHREGRFITDNGLDAYSQWYLAIDTDRPVDAKGRFQFPIGDFEQFHLSLLENARRQAERHDMHEILLGARWLIDVIEQREKD